MRYGKSLFFFLCITVIGLLLLIYHDNHRRPLAETELKKDNHRGPLAGTELKTDNHRGPLAETELKTDNHRGPLAETELKTDNHRGPLAETELKKTSSRKGGISVPNYNLPTYNSSTIARSNLIVISIFPLITDPSYKISNFGSVTKDRLEERMLDFLESLQYMLLHPLICEVHVFYDQILMPGYIFSRLGQSPKLKFDKLENAYNPKIVLEFVHQKFKDRLVMITNGDIYPWEGLDKLDYDLMKSKRLFYIMSRHGRREARCDMFPQVGYCDPGGEYFGSHDSYIFVPTDPLPAKGSEKLALHNWDSMGMENVILHIYKTFLKYKMLNPCKVIFVYHNHCSKLRHNDRKRAVPLTAELKKAMSPPTDQLM